jgi:hypothetical protein
MFTIELLWILRPNMYAFGDMNTWNIEHVLLVFMNRWMIDFSGKKLSIFYVVILLY